MQQLARFMLQIPKESKVDAAVEPDGKVADTLKKIEVDAAAARKE